MRRFFRRQFIADILRFVRVICRIAHSVQGVQKKNDSKAHVKDERNTLTYCCTGLVPASIDPAMNAGWRWHV